MIRHLKSYLAIVLVGALSNAYAADCMVQQPAQITINAGQSATITGQCAGMVDQVTWTVDSTSTVVSTGVISANTPIYFKTPTNLGAGAHTIQLTGSYQGGAAGTALNAGNLYVVAPTLAVQVNGSGTVTSTPAPGAGNAINCGATCTTTAYSGSDLVQLVPTASGSYGFSGWAGDCTGTGPCYLNMSTSHNVIATFDPLQTQTISFGTYPSSLAVNQSGTLGATSSSGLPVTFTSKTSSICTVSGTTVTAGGTVGTCTVAADQAGDSTYAAATEVTQNISVVNKTAQTITFGTYPSSLAVNQSGTLGATSSSGLTVTFSSKTPSICTVSGTTVTAGGTVGTCTVAADQAGDATNAAATEVTQNISVVNKTAQTITFGTYPSSLAVNQSGTLGANSSSGLTVTFSSKTPSICTVSGTTVTAGSTAGTCTVAADQAGNATYAAAPEVTQNITVTSGGGGTSPSTDPGQWTGLWVPPGTSNVFVLDQQGSKGNGSGDVVPGCLDQRVSLDQNNSSDCMNQSSLTDPAYGTGTNTAVSLNNGNIISIRFNGINTTNLTGTKIYIENTVGGNIGALTRVWVSTTPGGAALTNCDKQTTTMPTIWIGTDTAAGYCALPTTNALYYVNVEVMDGTPNVIAFLQEASSGMN